MKRLLPLILFILCYTVLSAQTRYSNTIPSKDQFMKFAGKPLADKFTNLKSVKVVYDVRSKKIYFFNAKNYTYHHDFCAEVLGFTDGIASFNKQSYNPTDKRTFLLANINYLADSDDWVMELASSDEMNATFINFFFNAVKDNTFFGDKLKFYLNSPQLIALQAKNELKIPIVFSDFIFKRISEQSIANATAVGILHKYDLTSTDSFNPSADEIIIINKTPEFIPAVKGIIVTELQTPLSHLVLLAKNRNIPVYVDTKIWDNPRIDVLLGERVELKTSTNTYTLAGTNKPIMATKDRKEMLLKKDLSVTGLVNLETAVPMSIEHAIGSKATNLALLKQIQKDVKGFSTPEYAFAIPFYFFDQHIKENNLQENIKSIYAIPKDSVHLLDMELKKMRKLVKSSKVNPSLLQMVEARLRQQQTFTNFRFRSSTNAEDMAGFNGAGLYDSKTAVIDHPNKTIEKAILEVWSSFWNFRAYQERVLFNINQESCAMGILVHRSFPDEIANGVLVSKNIYRNKYAGMTANVQLGEASVVKPDPGVTCDEFYCHNFNALGDFTIDYRSTSSLNAGAPILSKTQIYTLFRLSAVLERKLNALWRKRKMTNKYYPLDMEFKYLGDSKDLYIKQARAYMD